MSRFSRYSGRAALYAVLGFWSVVCLFPVYWLAVTSLKSAADIETGPRYVPFVDFPPDLSAWAFILFDPYENLLLRLANSGGVALASACLATLAATMVIYGLTRFPQPRLLRVSLMPLLLATRVLPPVAVVIPLYLLAKYSGTLDTRFSLVATYTAINLPVAAWLLRPVLGSRPSEQEEAARLDGASHRQILFSVALPMAARGLAVSALIVFILSWNEYLFAAYLATNEAMTVPTWLVGQMSIKEAQTGSEAEEWARFSAATVLLILPVVAFAAMAQKLIGRAFAYRA